MADEKRHIVILASGNGTNAAKIIAYFKNHPFIKVAGVVSNNPSAGVLTIAAAADLKTVICTKTEFANPDFNLQNYFTVRIDLVVLAGFLVLIPAHFIQQFPNRIINIHPSLLPKFGGKGMYGRFVYEAVLAAQEKETGISIHYVNEAFDEGEVLFQARCEVLKSDTVASLSDRVQALEHHYLPLFIAQLLTYQDNKN